MRVTIDLINACNRKCNKDNDNEFIFQFTLTYFYNLYFIH